MSSDIIWTLREAGAATSVGRFDPTVSVHDPSLSPDWLVLPVDKSIPKDVRGRRCRVIGSIWLDFAPNPDQSSECRHIEQTTRWHLIDESNEVAIAEVAGHGWIVVRVEEHMFVAMLRECVSQLRMQVFACGDEC